jgi:diaminohydroxyphosphoribosylaminopyrimidine deaminase/5-amino-6-(5-phosphoribosylamino)uracil reductase
MGFTAADHAFMSRALQLAAHGLYTTTPNPRVGCVLVKDGQVIGEGWHEKAGQPHAEINALAAAKVGTGATAYVTLEPCSHHGRTPPCTDALIAAGVTRVVAAMQDPNPLVAGQGLAILRRAGIAVDCGLMETAARELNIGFVSRMTRGRPWLRLKVAMSLDGKTALNNGVSQWITSPDARHDAHAWRARSCAVLTGFGTVRDDNPRLNVREIETSRQPRPVVIDSRLETPLDAKLLEGGALIFCAQHDATKIAALTERGAEVVVLQDTAGKVDLAAMLTELGKRGFNEVLVEAGAKLNASLLRSGLVDELLIYQAPVLLGDKARGMADLPELVELTGARRLTITDRRMVGVDQRILARLA